MTLVSSSKIEKILRGYDLQVFKINILILRINRKYLIVRLLQTF